MWIETDAATDQVLVFSETDHRGWNASVDGTPARVQRAFADFMATVVPAGRRRVRFAFEPASLRWGLRLSLLGLLVTALGTALLIRPAASARRDRINGRAGSPR